MKAARTEWGKLVLHTMVDKGLEMKDIAVGVGMTRQYVSAVIYGRTNSDPAVKKISDFLGIPDDV